MQPIFAPDFCNHSYGFRPKRNGHQAIAQILHNITTGYQDIVDIDLKNFFDQGPHDILLGLIYKKVKYKLMLKLLRSFLRAPIQIQGRLYKRRKGFPRGSSLTRKIH